jgi:hypothetical protein
MLECLISFVFGGFDKGKGTRSQNMLMRLFQANRPVTPSHFGNAVQCPWFILGSPHGRCFLGWASSGESEIVMHRNRPQNSGEGVWNFSLPPFSKTHQSLTEEHKKNFVTIRCNNMPKIANVNLHNKIQINF